MILVRHKTSGQIYSFSTLVKKLEEMGSDIEVIEAYMDSHFELVEYTLEPPVEKGTEVKVPKEIIKDILT